MGSFFNSISSKISSLHFKLKFKSVLSRDMCIFKYKHFFHKHLALISFTTKQLAG